jgi:tetratricopeptide (TPR) repeat protein
MADAFYEDLGIDVRVVTLKKQGSIERQSERAFRKRKIGATAPTGGILVLLNPVTQQARIEVSYSLEGGLTDLQMGRIARDQLAPYVSYASAGMAVMDVLHYLRDQVYLSASMGDIRLGEEFRRRPAFEAYERFVSGGAGAKTALSAIPMDADLKRRVPHDQRVRYSPSATIQESVAAYLRASADLAGDPTLPLFTEGSRMMRAAYPFARFEELERLERLDASLPLEYHVKANMRSPRAPAPPRDSSRCCSIASRVCGGSTTSKPGKTSSLTATGTISCATRTRLTRSGSRNSARAATTTSNSFRSAAAPLRRSWRPSTGHRDALSLLRRAEVSLRNAFVFPQALADYEKAIEAAPDDPLVLQTFAERAMYLGFPELAAPAFEKAGPGFEIELAEAFHELGDAKSARKWIARALEDDRYNLHALKWKKYLAEQDGTPDEAQLARAEIALVTSIPTRLTDPVWLRFDPERPQFHDEDVVRSGGTNVYDHSQFGVTMTNTSRRPVVIESVQLTSRGTASASGLGDVKNYWAYPSGGNQLAPGESVSFDKLWGFTVDTGHEHVRYTFRTCWHGVGETVRQCRVQWVDVLP